MIENVMKDVKKLQCDGFFVSKIHNVRYLSKYTSDDAYLLLTPNKYYFITDARYTEQAEDECKGFEVVNWRKPGKALADTIAEISRENGLQSIAFEADQLTYLNYDSLRNKLDDIDMTPVTDIVEKYRSIKTSKEIVYSKTACEISCRAFERILNDIKVGVSEKEIAAKLSYYMVKEGSDSKPYGDIVISGARTSLLHGIPSDKKVEYGDFVLMDFGCAYKGYLSDMTRTVVVGKASDEQKKVYKLEQQMIEDSLKMMKGGMPATEVYKASVKAIEGTEYYKYHYAGIGHGVGLFVHEIPFMGPLSKEILTPGNIITIEPGIYIPNWGGVRIEDQVLITEDGHENFITATKELIEL